MPSQCGINTEINTNKSYCMSKNQCKSVGKNFCGSNKTKMIEKYNNGTPKCGKDNDCSLWKDYWNYKPNEDP